MKTLKFLLLSALAVAATPARGGITNHWPVNGLHHVLTFPNCGVIVERKASLTNTAWTFVCATNSGNGLFAFTNTPDCCLFFYRSTFTNFMGTPTNWVTGIMGAIKLTFPTGQTAFAPPFHLGSGYISNHFREVPAGTAIIQTTTGNSGYTTNYFDGTSWSIPPATIALGRGLFVLNTNAPFTAGFSGEVHTDQVSQTFGGTYNFVASKMPKAGYLVDLGFDNDQSDSVSVHLWSGTAWIEVGWTEEDGWAQPTGYNVDAVKGPWLEIGQPIIVERHGSDSPTWIQPGAQ